MEAAAALQRLFTIDLSEVDRASEVLRKYGVVVISNAVPRDECAQHARALVLQTVSMSSPTVKVADPERTWLPEDTPPAVRPGLMQGRVGASAPAWRIRTMPVWRTVFGAVFSGLRGVPVTDFVTSIDGINVLPPRRDTCAPPPGAPPARDWAHIDTTTRSNPFLCVQGQVVLNDTTAGFRCSPCSHLVYEQLLDMQGIAGVEDGNPAGGWCLLSQDNYEAAKRLIEGVGGAFQVPIVVPAGSIILWLSSTLHSAKAQDGPVAGAAAVGSKDMLANWRVVAYVCWRPKADVGAQHLATLRDAVRQGRCTNHSGTKVFPRYPPTQRDTVYSKAVTKWVSPESDRLFCPAELLPGMRELLFARNDTRPWSDEAELEKVDAIPRRWRAAGGGGAGGGGGGRREATRGGRGAAAK